MLRVVIIGYGEMFTNLIAAALDAECNIVGVLRRETVKYHPVIRKLKDIFCPSLEYNYIRSYKLPEIYTTKGVNSPEFKKAMLKLNPDIILVGSWGEKIKKEIYNLPKIASINAHPSLLPKYRGPNPYFWTIRNQEQVSGITFHLIDSGYDTGAILAQEEVKIYPSDTGETLKQRTVLTARGVACELLKALSEDIIIPLQQREDKASYYSYPEGLELDFKKTAEENYAIIRGIHPWGRAYFFHKTTPFAPKAVSTYIEDNDSIYTDAGRITNVNTKSKTISVLCGNNKILRMSDIDLYNRFDRPFTRNYISLDVKEGDFIL